MMHPPAIIAVSPQKEGDPGRHRLDLHVLRSRRFFVRLRTNLISPASRSPPVSQKTHEEIVVDPVTLASGGFDRLAIDDRQAAMMVANEPGALQVAGGFGHAGAPDAK